MKETSNNGPARRTAAPSGRSPRAPSTGPTPAALPGVWLPETPPDRPVLGRFPAWVPLNDAAIRALYTRPVLAALDPRN